MNGSQVCSQKLHQDAPLLLGAVVTMNQRRSGVHQGCQRKLQWISILKLMCKRQNKNNIHQSKTLLFGWQNIAKGQNIWGSSNNVTNRLCSEIEAKTKVEYQWRWFNGIYPTEWTMYEVKLHSNKKTVYITLFDRCNAFYSAEEKTSMLWC